MHIISAAEFPLLYSAQILLENALLCRQNARLKDRLLCSKFCRQNLSKPTSVRSNKHTIPLCCANGLQIKLAHSRSYNAVLSPFYFLSFRYLVHGPDQISVPNRGTKRECYQLIVLPEVF